ncbi:DUF2306 domain-containing protein [Mesorhizobium sp. LjRoot246]|uniref:DUF2306 domain-containing protein n=1 Tax=Mesorhizobium sp. LjRoot246 TaxID=3342294 RepID=UPI003ECFC7CD
MKTSTKTVGVAAWATIGVVCLIYAPMAIEYMVQYFASWAPELYLHSISAVISLNPDSQVGSLVHHQLPTYINSRWIMLVHTATAGLALLLGVLQFSARVRRNWPAVHRFSGRLMLTIVAVSMITALAFLFRTGSAATTSGPPFFNILLIFAICVLAAAVLAFLAIKERQIKLHQAFMTYMFAMLLTAPIIRIIVITLLLVASGESFDSDFMIGAGVAGPLAVFGAAVVVRFGDRSVEPGSSIVDHPAMARGAWVAGAIGLIAVILVGAELVGQIDLPLAAVTAATVVLLLACVALRLRSRAAGNHQAATDWEILQSATAATPVACLALSAIYCLFWPAPVAFYCAVLASPVVAMSLGYLPFALLRRKSMGKASRAAVAAH